MSADISERNIKVTTKRLLLLVLVMFGFGFALVPIYNVFCDVTGINGKNGNLAVDQANALTIDKNRYINIEFDTNVNEKLPWSFAPKNYKIKVHPGEVAEETYIVKNNTDQTIVGQAIPSVAPSEAALYFKKTECFCFTQQTLKPHEQREMKVRFVVKPKIPAKIETMTLSYTFFMVSGNKKITNL